VHADLHEGTVFVCREPVTVQLADYALGLSPDSRTLARWPAAWRSLLAPAAPPPHRAHEALVPTREALSPEVDLHLLQAMLLPHLSSFAASPGCEREHAHLVHFLQSLDLDAAPPADTRRRGAYASASEALTALRRSLRSESSACQTFASAERFYVAHGAIDSVSTAVLGAVDTREFQRLRGLCQVGLAKLVYPGACHTRFEHSVSAFDFSLTYLKAILGARGSEAFREAVTDADAAACAVAALLHDVGHVPFRHYLGGLPNAPTQKAGAMRLLEPASSALRAGVAEALRPFGGTLESFLDFFQYTFKPYPRPERPHWFALARVINGPIDVDKLSYLTLDGLHTGLPYASALEPQALARSLVAVRAGEVFDLALDDQARIPAEQLAVSRYAMYSAVYWHRTVRAFSSMLRRAFDVANAGRAAEDVLEEVLWLSDEAFLAWLLKGLGARAPEERWLIEDIHRRAPVRRAVTLRSSEDSGGEERALHDAVARVCTAQPGEAVRALEECLRIALERFYGGRRRVEAVLVDFPGTAKADAGDLHFVHGASGALIGAGPLWQAIRQNFELWAAKARIFVKPGFEVTCEERPRLLEALLRAVGVERVGAADSPQAEIAEQSPAKP
jgi:HD superfamily phosphohydrolase